MQLYFDSQFNLSGLARTIPSSISATNFSGLFMNLFIRNGFFSAFIWGGANDESPPIAMTALSKKLLRRAKLSAVVGFQRRDDGLHHHCYCDDSRIEGADRAIPGIRLATAFSRPVSRKFNGRLRCSSGGPEGADQIFGSRL